MALWKGSIGLAYFLKRTSDIAVSILALIILSPIFLITSIAIFINNPGPIFFNQNRVGKNGKHFNFYKFRSMINNAHLKRDELQNKNESKDGVIFKMENDPRVTKTGKIIRRLSIDELPQLLNVLKGEMSLIGPRPPLPSEVSEYSLEDRKRLNVIPGITCFWQISGRSEIPFKQQVELDLQYIKSRNFFTDIKILLKTIPAVFSGRGAY